MDILLDIVRAIQAKKEISAIDESWIRERLQLLLEKRKAIHLKMQQARDFRQFSRSGEYEALLKAVRADLHAVYGTFQRQVHARRKAFNELRGAYEHKDTRIMALHEKILSTHTSTRERLPFYPTIYKRIFAKTGIPRTLLDVSCGLNPFSYPWMGMDGTYHATEVTREDCEMVRQYFAFAHITGSVTQLDILKDCSALKTFRADVCFLWKLLDTLEYYRRDISKELLPVIRAPTLIVSFSTRTLTGKPMRKTRRMWFEQFCTDQEWLLDTEECANELFYIVKRPSLL
ncbi:hypothetical protein HY639_05190 [Candidatus Woesearchaeota archaeon]|nr:hypothetical protein [Candidatus Woesearchaeota archaeon]